jgi:5S rRNA maturation endonuclease (ribonuclease M5)
MQIWNYEVIVEALPDILDHFGIKFVKFKNRLSLACPIHEGSKQDALSIYTTGTKFIGNWVCFTKHCEEEQGKTIMDFLSALLRKCEVTIPVRDWLKGFIGGNLTEEVSPSYYSKKEAISTADILTKESPSQLGVSRHYIRSSLIIPAKYYLERGYTRSILERYDVGLCLSKGKQMDGRIVVPVYDDAGNNMVGCVGRTTKPHCLLCKKYHREEETCPVSSYEQYLASKWINSKDFKAENYLYNFWNVKEHVEEWNSVILTEGQGDVWRLEEAGIPIGLGVFGAKITDGQLIKLQSLPMTNIILAMDSDEAGEKANDNIVNRLRRFYNVETVKLPSKDVGDMSVEDIKALFLPILNRYKLSCNHI